MSLEQLIICHCAPVLRGIKVSNLVSCSCADYPDFDRELSEFSARIKPFGLECRVLCKCKKFALTFVYRKKELEQLLAQESVASFLMCSGYTAETAEGLLAELSERLSVCNGFPHEIGIFLGYPLEDVIGFTQNQGRNFKYSGYWKVYGDPEKAKVMFSNYSICTEECSLLAMNGGTVEQVIMNAELKTA